MKRSYRVDNDAGSILDEKRRDGKMKRKKENKGKRRRKATD